MPSPPTRTLNDDGEPTGASRLGDTADTPAPVPLSPHSASTHSVESPLTDPSPRTATSSSPRDGGGPLPQIPGYVVVRRIGGGGMGEVYEAINRLDRRVALKLIRPDRDDPEFLVRFRKEAAALQDLDHPNVARIFEYNEHDGVPFFTMRLLTGGTLAERLAEFQAEPRRAVELMATVAEAVGYVHGRNLLHRDLKPSNILFDDRGRPYVSDFGLVKDLPDLDVTPVDDPEPPAAGDSPHPVDRARTFLGGLLESDLPPHGGLGLDSRGTLTQSGRVLGTLPYMSPEQVLGQVREIGPGTDVWAMGVMLYELVTRRRPFSAPGVESLQASIEHDPPPGPATVVAGLCPDLDRIIMRCLAKSPGDRPRGAEDLARTLRSWLARAGAPAPGPEVSKRRYPSRRAALVMLGSGAVATAAAVGGYFALRRPPPPPPADPMALLQEELLNKGEAVLCGDSGWPAWKESLVPGVEFGDPAGGGDGCFFKTSTVALIEFARGLTVFGIRLSLDVRHVADRIGQVGVYVGRTAHQVPGGVRHCFVGLSLTNQGPKPPDPPSDHLVLAIRSCDVPGAAGFFHTPSIGGDRKSQVPPDGWRHIALQVSGSAVTAFADGKVVVSVTHSQLMAFASKLSLTRPDFDGVTPTFKVPEGIGVFAAECGVKMRRIRLERFDG